MQLLRRNIFARFVAIVFCVVCIFSQARVFAAEHSLLFLGNKNIIPVVYLDNGVPTGVAVDIVKALGEHINEPIEIVAMDWLQAQSLVASGSADALIQINQTEERKKIYDFSDTLLQSDFRIFTKTEKVNVLGQSSLHGLKVGVEKGGLPQTVLGKDGLITLVIVPNFLDGFTSLLKGEIDALVVDYRVGSYVIASNNLRGIKVAGEPIVSSYSSIAVRKGNTALLNKINAALARIKADGTYQKILEKWHPEETVFLTEEQLRTRAMQTATIYLSVLLIVTCILLFFLGWTLSKRTRAERYVRELIQKIQAAVVVHGADTCILSSNATAQELLGLTEEQLFGKAAIDPTWHFFHENGEAVKPEKYPVNIVLSSHKSLRNYTLRVHRPTKEKDVWVLVNGDPVVNEKNEIIQVIITFVDITERKEAEEKLKRLNEKNEKILNSAGEGIYGVDSEGNIMFINTSGAKMLGYNPEDIIGKNSHELFHHTKADGSPYSINDCPLHKTLKKGEVTRGEDEMFWTQSGKNFDVNYVCTPLIDGDKIVGAVIIFDNITERKHAEQTIRDSEEKFSAIFHAAPYLIAITNSDDGTIIDVNEGYTQLLGYLREESIGKTTTKLDIWGIPADRDRFVSLLKKDGFVYNFKTVLRRKDGTLIDVLDSAKLIKISGVNYILSIAVDVTKESQLENAKNEFLNLIAHHLRTVPGAMKWIMELLSPEVERCLSARDLQLWRSLEDTDSRLIELADAISLAAEAQLSRISIHPTRFDLPALINEIIDVYRPTITEKELKVTCNFQGVAQVLLDKKQVKKVISAIISNAIHYTPSKGGVEIKLSYINNRLLLKITDSGIGIPKDQQKKVFTKFFRAKNVVKVDVNGLGLGLYASKIIVEQLKGKIWFESEEGKGSIFYVELP